jgi:hypothetical protein
MPWFADILLNMCVCGAWTTHNQQTQPSQPAIALTKNTNEKSLHDPPGIVIEIVGTDAGDRGRTCEERVGGRCGGAIFFLLIFLIPTLP